MPFALHVVHKRIVLDGLRPPSNVEAGLKQNSAGTVETILDGSFGNAVVLGSSGGRGIMPLPKLGYSTFDLTGPIGIHALDFFIASTKF